MKVKTYLFILIFPLVLSCKNNPETKITYTDVDTVKETIKNRENEIAWSKELESTRLTEKIDNGVKTKDIKVTPNLMKIKSGFQNPVYPEFEDFGKLDTRSLDNFTYNSINSLCKDLSENFYCNVSSYISSKYMFNYVFFRNDFIGGWENVFNEKFPYSKDEIENNISTQEKEIPKIFETWIIGEPFIGEKIVQIPVRFYCKHGTVDVTLYIEKSQKLIYQITIDRWEKV